MNVHHEEFIIDTKGNADIIDITSNIKEAIAKSDILNGIINVFSVGSTAAVSIIEYEPGLKKDFKSIMEKLVPSNIEYEHHKRWGDYNGHSHIRSTLIKSSITIPLMNGKPVLGTWQQVILIDFDVRPRKRRLIITIIGEGNY